jgi:uroporphyrinogen-III synthase
VLPTEASELSVPDGQGPNGHAPTALLPLEGYTVAITSDRRREELSTFLGKRGARVISTPMIRIVPRTGEIELRQVTEACLAQPLDIVVATTGIGFRGWMEAADGWGLGDRLRERLECSELIARGPKARGAIRAAGLTESWSPGSESMSEVLAYLLDQDLRGRRIGVQLHGEPLDDVIDALTRAGALVTTISVYGWSGPSDLVGATRLVHAVAAGLVDGVVFTSAPAATAMINVAREEGVEEELLEAFRRDVVVACVGPICAVPFAGRDVDVVLPERARLGSLIHAVVEEVPAQRTLRIRAAGRCLEVRGHIVVLDGTPIPLNPAPMAILRELAREPGVVRTRDELAARLPGDDSGPRGVEMTVTRLRSALGDPRLVETIVKRGYRLECDSAGDHLD